MITLLSGANGRNKQLVQEVAERAEPWFATENISLILCFLCSFLLDGFGRDYKH
jgi:hypothetical protein